jgi:hypothetical protein
MRRSALVTVAVLGGLVCLLGGTVLYSALQDTARTGINSVDSAALGGSAEIQLATATFTQGSGVTCGTFSEDLASGFFTATGVVPGSYSSNEQYFCIRNVGSQQVTLSALTDALTDVDSACTGDEEVAGDTTCGGDQAGELSSVLSVTYTTRDCTGGQQLGGSTHGLKGNETTPAPFGTLTPGARGCYTARIAYPSPSTFAAAQTAQSDRATWRFKFTAQA